MPEGPARSAQTEDIVTPEPRSDRPGGETPDQDAMAVDALPDEVRLHADGDETDLTQTSAGGTEVAEGSAADRDTAEGDGPPSNPAAGDDER